jgi:hypothetical protein
LEDVVNAGEREVGILLLLALAVRVEPLAEVADALLESCPSPFFLRWIFTKSEKMSRL